MEDGARLRQALKEWSIAVDALEQGDTIVLLRKGGIREQGGKFSVAHEQVLLYPTYEHQKPELLKAPYCDRVQPVPSRWHPEKIKISSVAKITDVFQITEASIVEALLPFHIWNARFVIDRLKWKPKSPLYVLLLRVSHLFQPHMISYQDTYGGCKSWIELADEIDLEGVIPVLSDAKYAHQMIRIRSTIEGKFLPPNP